MFGCRERKPLPQERVAGPTPYNRAMPRLLPAEAAATLHAGGVIAYPTEAVWGLGCDPFDEAAVLRLLAIKQRPVDKGLILIAASVAQLDGLARSEEHTSELQSLMRISYAV